MTLEIITGTMVVILGVILISYYTWRGMVALHNKINAWLEWIKRQ